MFKENQMFKLQDPREFSPGPGARPSRALQRSKRKRLHFIRRRKKRRHFLIEILSGGHPSLRSV
jgi:hypothetical protein